MKIIQTPARFYPYIGGTEQVVFHLSRELVKRGHSVKVICADEPLAGNSVIDRVKVERLPSIRKIANSNITLSLFIKLMKEDFDVIHTHLPHPWSADISAWVSLVKNKPLFLTYHNDITGQGINKNIASFYNLTALKFLLRKACRIFITHKRYFTSSAFLSPFANKVVVSPPGVDTDKFKSLKIDNKAENTVFFLSCLDEFHRYKGLDYLISSIKKVREAMSLTLYVGGDGELAEYYKQIAKNQGVEKAVVFLGGLTENQVVEYYNLCDVFVLPSISSTQEGFGLVALEAMACKKPVIVTDIVGVAEDIKRYSAGIVVPSKDPDALGKALQYLLANRKEAESRGENALELIKKKYTWQKHTDIVEREYLKMKL